MLFNSYEFLLAFLPLTLLGFYLTGLYVSHRAAVAFLVVASLFFYGWWNPAYLLLLISSLLFNFAIGRRLAAVGPSRSRALLVVGVAFNLAAIGYFKYSNFFVDSINVAFDVSFNLERIILPLAISFFTFQQIAFLVDTHQGKTREVRFLEYALFVTFFPQLIAGPIVHHKEMMPQFATRRDFRADWGYLGTGVTIFMLGLFKKTVIADSMSGYVGLVFRAADQGEAMPFFGAWAGTLAYSLQIYFDFSGYSDMAYGLAQMFGIRLPVNFFSPYQSPNIITFWRTWHMTLSRFLRDYLYVPLGGNRHGTARRHVNLMITMLLGGLWHGAGGTFVIWGGLHGLYLIVNHGWCHLTRSWRDTTWLPRWWGTLWGTALTFMCVTVAWVFFRAETLEGSLVMIRAMSGSEGIRFHPGLLNYFPFLEGIIQLTSPLERWFGPVESRKAIPEILTVLTLVFVLPNVYQYMRIAVPQAGRELRRLQWVTFRPSPLHALFAAVITLWAIAYVNAQSEFLYFQF